MSIDIPKFATDFGSMMLQVYGELCAERELAEPDELVVTYRRAESTVNNVAAVVVLGSPEAIDRFMKENDLD
jgi:hypothetical protein